MIRRQLCNATDLYPVLSSPENSGAEVIEPLPLQSPESVLPGEAEPLPVPLQNPAAGAVSPVHLASTAHGPEPAGQVIPAYAQLPVGEPRGEWLPLALPPTSGESGGSTVR
jgi:hypothetical protein